VDAGAFARLASELHDAPGVEETVETVVHFALHAENCAYAGVALAGGDGRAEIGAVTDPIIEAIYAAQIEAGDGPMLAAMASGSTVYIPDVATEDRWPDWRADVTAAKICSVLHVPMKAADQVIGVLTLYTQHPDAFTPTTRRSPTSWPGTPRSRSPRHGTARQETSLALAVDARKLVGQAMGILMERFDVDGDRAFAILRRYSQDTNTKLRDVAQHLIDTRKLPAT
jgi:putative methionine-R-sulfoxide reductase with GAF domain